MDQLYRLKVNLILWLRRVVRSPPLLVHLLKHYKRCYNHEILYLILFDFPIF